MTSKQVTPVQFPLGFFIHFEKIIRHEGRGLDLTLGHILNSSREIVVVAVVGGTVAGVGEVSRVQLECGDGNSVDRVFPSLGEM